MYASPKPCFPVNRPKNHSVTKVLLLLLCRQTLLLFPLSPTSITAPECHSLLIVWALTHLLFYFAIDLLLNAVHLFSTPPTTSHSVETYFRLCHFWRYSTSLRHFLLFRELRMSHIQMFMNSEIVDQCRSANVSSVIGRKTDGAFFSVIIYSSSQSSWSDAPWETLPGCALFSLQSRNDSGWTNHLSHDWHMLQQDSQQAYQNSKPLSLSKPGCRLLPQLQSFQSCWDPVRCLEMQSSVFREGQGVSSEAREYKEVLFNMSVKQQLYNSFQSFISRLVQSNWWGNWVTAWIKLKAKGFLHRDWKSLKSRLQCERFPPEPMLWFAGIFWQWDFVVTVKWLS